VPLQVTRDDRMEQSTRETKRRGAEAINKALNAGAEVMRQLCPEDTGELKGSINVEGNVVGCLGRGIYPEFGTPDQEAQPFFRPGIESARRSLINQFGPAGGPRKI
jgi:HK97 gp10 family phage protein